MGKVMSRPISFCGASVLALLMGAASSAALAQGQDGADGRADAPPGAQSDATRGYDRIYSTPQAPASTDEKRAAEEDSPLELSATAPTAVALDTPGPSATTRATGPQNPAPYAFDIAPAKSAPLIPQAVNKGKAWKIYKTAWDEADEDGYAHFIKAIGWSDCTSLESCLSDPANPYSADDDTVFSGDCADMAYIMRAYYAWKNGLAFSYQSAMRTANGKAEDVRYSTDGNIVAGRRSAIGASPVSGPSFIRTMPGRVSTAMFRTHPETGGGSSFDDFYPIEITREAVRPGVIAYDVFGHVGIVYDILEDGRVLVIASHPDHSVTRTVYGPNFLRAKPALGSGLKAWRPIYLEGARKRSDGSYAGGRVKAKSNKELHDYSMEQYLGSTPHPSGDWRLGEFHVSGRTTNYYDFVRRRLAAPDYAYNPVTELRNGLEAICGAVRDRKYAVDRARTSKIYLKPHPKRLPPNIFGTYGLWEEYSTPSRDARLKVAFIELRRSTERLVESVETGDPSVSYDGESLANDLWAAFEEENAQCKFSYWRTDDSRVRLDLNQAMARLWGLSFDPYHCPERRWGATGAELATCTDDDTKTRWYNAQRFLRYQAERTYDVRMDFTLDQLKAPSIASPAEGGIGVDAPADADLRRYLANLVRDGDDQSTPPSAPEATADAVGGILLTGADAVAAEPRFPEWHYKKILNHWGLKND